MAQAISNTTQNPYGFGNLTRSFSGKQDYSKKFSFERGKTPQPTKGVQGVLTGPNRNMSGAAGGLIAPYTPVKKQDTPVVQDKPVVTTAPDAPTVPAPVMTTPSGIPVTGNPSTFAGGPTTPKTTGFRGLFPDVVSSLAGNARYVDPVTKAATERAAQLTTQLRESRENQARDEAKQRLAPIPIGDATGRQQVTRQLYEQQQTALANELAGQTQLAGVGQTQQELQQAALGTAAGYAAPQANFPFVFNPVTGTYETAPGVGGGTGGSFDPQTQAQNLANEVVTGSRTYADALGALGFAGTAGQTFLNDAIRAINPQFSFAQAEALGSTQGTIGPAYKIANDALAKVETALNALPAFARTNIPLISTHGAGIAAQLGINATQLQQYGAAVQTLKNSYASLLASVRGGTPSAYTEQVNVEVPDWPTPAQLQAVRNNMETLGKSRVEIFSSPGQVTPFTSESVSGFDW